MVKVDQPIDGEPCWLDLMTPDRQAIKRFYSVLFGWDFVDRDEEGMPYTMALREGLPVAGMGTLEADSPMPSSWTTYFCSKDVDTSVKTVSDAGGAVLMESTEVGPQGKMAICADPEGSVFGLWQPGLHRGSAFVGEHGSMCWFEVNVRDAERARAFYERVMGARSEKMDMPGMTYFTFKSPTRERPHSGLLQMTTEWGDLPAHWMAYFAVDDTDAACEAARSGGGQVKHGPFDTPFGRMAVIADPAGAILTIIKPAEGR